jgi:hypothetical protein
VHRADNLPIVLKSGSLNLLEPLGPLQACNGITLPLRFYARRVSVHTSLYLARCEMFTFVWSLQSASHEHGTEVLSKKQRYVNIFVLSVQLNYFFTCAVHTKCKGLRFWCTLLRICKLLNNFSGVCIVARRRVGQTKLGYIPGRAVI